MSTLPPIPTPGTPIPAPVDGQAAGRLAHAPTLSDFLSAFFTGKPLLPANLYTWVGFAREAGLFILLDVAAFLYQVFTGHGGLTPAVWILAGLQAAYILINLIWRALRAAHSPLAPLFAVGVQFIDDLMVARGGVAPDMSGGPIVPGEMLPPPTESVVSTPPTATVFIPPGTPKPIMLAGAVLPPIAGDPTPPPPPPLVEGV